MDKERGDWLGWVLIVIAATIAGIFLGWFLAVSGMGQPYGGAW